MHLTTAQSSLIVLGIYLAFGLLELASTRLFAKDEQTRHDGILEAVSTIVLLAIVAVSASALLLWLDRRLHHRVA